MTKCDFCRYGKMQNGKFECTANCWTQQIYACEEAIEKMMKYAQLIAKNK